MHFPFSKPPALRPYGVGELGFSLDQLAGAITRQEGACSAPGVCVNNNPGNLRAYRSDQPVDSRGIRIFPSFEAGYAALIGQEQINIGKGLTTQEFFGGKPGVYPGYAPAADNNNPTGYAANVSSWLGIPSDVPLSSLLDGSSASPAYSPSPVFTESTGDDSGVEDGGLSTAAKVAIGLGVLGALWAAS